MAPPADTPEAPNGAQNASDQQISDQEYDMLMNYPENLDFYSLLALPRDPPPTEAQIRSAYHSLTLSFHPDKQAPELRDAANTHYNRIRTAYETLIDPKKRAVYDMMGEDAVRQEWGAGGAMGVNGEAEQQQVGVKAMDVAQFRRWFLMTMKKRERKALDQMVQAKGMIQLRVDARPLFFPKPNDPAANGLRPQSLSLGFGFTTPFKLFRWLQVANDDDVRDENGEGQGQIEAQDAHDEDVELEITAAIGGGFKTMTQEATFVDPETQEEETRSVPLPPMLLASSISLGASMRRAIAGMEPRKGFLNKYLHPIVGDSVVQVGATALPEPSIQATVHKSITLVKNTFPVNCAFQSTFSESPLHSPPAVSISTSRNLGPRSLVYGNWSSGVMMWPRVVERVFASLTGRAMDEEIHVILPGQTSKFELGFYSLPKRRSKDHGKQDTDEEEITGIDDSEEPVIEGPAGEPMEAWSVHAHTSPMNLQLSVNYSRNIFTGVVDEPVLSEWNLEGYYPNKKKRGDRSVRLQVATAVQADLSVSWTVSGSRKVGEFSRLGLAVSIEGGTGLVVSVFWKRLGQGLKLPVVLLPVEQAKDFGTVAVIAPWVAYSVLEFCFLRPRERRKQQRQLSKQRKRIQKLVDKRKSESSEAIHLMMDQVNRRQAREAKKDGLVILHAEYGYFGKDQNGESEAPRKTTNVTIPVAALVESSQLIIPGNVVKSHIPGFYDPAPLLPKVLKVRYRFGGKEHNVEVDDSEGLTCPMRSHVV